MTVTTWPDVSEWQPPVTDAFAGPLICTRTSLSNYKVDNNIGLNTAWQQRKRKSGQLAFEFYYHVWYPGNEAAQYDLAMRAIGGARPGVAMMLDLETWQGAIGGNHTMSIENLRMRFARALGNELRVPVYGNNGDLSELYPGRPSNVPVVLASYGPDWWNTGSEIAQQYTNGIIAGPPGMPISAPPFGRCDFNGARMSMAQLKAALGQSASTSGESTASATSKPITPTARRGTAMYEVLLCESGEYFQYSDLVFDNIKTMGELQRVAASPLNAAGPGKYRKITRIDREHYRNVTFRNRAAVQGKAA